MNPVSWTLILTELAVDRTVDVREADRLHVVIIETARDLEPAVDHQLVDDRRRTTEMIVTIVDALL